MAKYISIKNRRGVCYSESKTSKFRGKPDRSYWIRFRDQTGKLRYEKCGWASEGWTPEAAQQKRFKLLEQERVGEYKPRDQRKKDSITLSDFFETYYLPWAKKSKARPKDDISRYKTWLKSRLGEKKLGEIAAQDIEDIFSEMQSVGRADATIRQVFALLRHIFNKATEWNLWNGDNPCAGIRLPKLNNARQKYLRKDESDLLLAALRKHSIQVAQIAYLSLYTGMRLDEILSLKWQDIDMEHGFITVLDPKNSQSRQVFISDPARQILEEIPSNGKSDLVFTNRKGEKIKYLSKTFSRVVKATGLNAGVSDRRYMVSFHTLRHTFASRAAKKGIPMYHLAKAMGHKTTAMTERYSHLAPEDLESVFKAAASSYNDLKS